METLEKIINFEILKIGSYILSVQKVLIGVFIFLGSYIILGLLKRILFKKKVLTKYEKGSILSIYQIIKYVVWTTAIVLILEVFGLNINVLLAGSAALLVGVGLGLQNTFNDFVSGLIILFEGSIRVGDILQIDGDVVKMKKIGFRASEAINRDDIVIIIPNSKITSNNVINWSHQSKNTRFKIYVGVSYSSNINKVIEILKKCASQHQEVIEKKLVNARFIEFGNSSLDFELLFFSKNIFRIENIKSDIRKNIFNEFRKNNIEIPFKQIDLHIKNNNITKL